MEVPVLLPLAAVRTLGTCQLLQPFRKDALPLASLLGTLQNQILLGSVPEKKKIGHIKCFFSFSHRVTRRKFQLTLFFDGSENDRAAWGPPALSDGPERDLVMGSWHEAGGTYCPVLKLPKHHAVLCGPGWAVPAVLRARWRGLRAGWLRDAGCGSRHRGYPSAEPVAMAMGAEDAESGTSFGGGRDGQHPAAPSSTRPTCRCTAPSLLCGPWEEGMLPAAPRACT